MESLRLIHNQNKENVHQLTPFRKPRSLSQGSFNNHGEIPTSKINTLALKTNLGEKQQPRRALGNLSNVSSDAKIAKKTVQSQDEEIIKEVKPRRPLKSYPDAEKMPASFDIEDDYEDILPKSQRLTVEEIRRLARWVPRYDIASMPIEEDHYSVELDDICYKLADIAEVSFEEYDPLSMFEKEIFEPVQLP